MANAYTSARLVYKAVETPDDDEYLLTRQQDTTALSNSYSGLLRPANKASIEDLKKYFQSCLLAVIICLPPAEEGGAPTRIGEITLSGPNPKFAHHRNANLGIGIAKGYQGKGYGSEAIEWMLEWGFQRAGLHRIGIGAFSWNKRAADLYERLGFVPEGRVREAFWYNGEWGDALDLSMLEHEWRARRDKKIEASMTA